ncbi:hypothetical protein EDB87DRAFT_103985 [Lactarius vividus]|nr:hypothetical protein EDB87DRAFT_103985 [Lactarius vividus]
MYPTSLLTAVSPAQHCTSTRILFLSYRTAAAVDPFTLTKKHGNKAHEAAQQAAASVGLEMVIGHMRRFVEDFGSAPTLLFPPMSRHARKSVHELANTFNLRSKGEGNGVARFTGVIKTSLSSAQVDERNVALILVKPLPHVVRERQGVRPTRGMAKSLHQRGVECRASDVVGHMMGREKSDRCHLLVAVISELGLANSRSGW